MMIVAWKALSEKNFIVCLEECYIFCIFATINDKY